MKKYLKTLLILLFTVLFSFSCSLTTEEDKGSLTLTLPSFDINTPNFLSRSSNDNPFPQIIKEYSITMRPSNSDKNIFEEVIEANNQEGSVTINNLFPNKYVITVIGETDLYLYSKTQEITIKSGKNTCDINLDRTAKEHRGYYVNAKASSEGNGTKTYPYKTINYALKNAPSSSSDITLFLEGSFTENVSIDSSCRYTNVKLQKAPDITDYPQISAPTTILQDSYGVMRELARPIININKDNAVVDINKVDFNCTGEIGNNMDVPQEGVREEGVINILNGTCIVQHSNINMPMMGNIGEEYVGAKNVFVGAKGKLKLGGNINFDSDSTITLDFNSLETYEYTPISIVSDLENIRKINFELQSIEDNYPKLLESENGVDISKYAHLFTDINPIDGYGYGVDENGYVKRTHVFLRPIFDSEYEKAEITIDNKTYTFENVKPTTPLPIREEATSETHNPPYVLFNVGQTYDIEVKLYERGNVRYTQKYKMPMKDITTPYRRYNNDLNIISTVVSYNVDNSPDIVENPNLRQYKDLDSVIKAIKEYKNNIYLVSEQPRFGIEINFNSYNLESKTPIVIDYPLILSIMAKGQTGNLFNDTTELFHINHMDANISLNGVTIQGGSQVLNDSGLIKVSKGTLELNGTPIQTRKSSTELNGVYVKSGAKVILNGVPGVETTESVYNGTFSNPIYLENNSNLVINYDKASAQNILVRVPLNIDPKYKHITSINGGNLTELQRMSPRVFAFDGQKEIIFDVTPEGFITKSVIPPTM